MIKQFFHRLRHGNISLAEPRSAVARWCIQQFIVCPYCKHEFDIIQHNLNRHLSQGTIKVTQKVVQRYDKDKFDYMETTTEVPRPPYFGCMMEDTQNLTEEIECEQCDKIIKVNETTWGYGK